jgi:CubicO group peptidase (beta-lactamase class C family)
MRVPAPLIAVVAATSAFGQELPSANRLDARSLEAFADGFLPSEMAKRNIPGAVLTVVSRGQLVLARGFGFADLKAQRRVDPNRTLFHVGSVTKVVTATAALQLVERGHLDLAKNVNAYLRSFHLASDRGPSVTLHHLLTHTAGFEERLTGIFCKRASERQPLATYLAHSMPRRFARPGEVLSYSNHGMSLAALLVEDVSGRRFEDYVSEEILAPLGMSRSGFLLTGDAAKDVAIAYQFVNGHHRGQLPDCVQTVGAGGFATTGTEMARFMIAHLEGGAYEGARIVRGGTMDRIHARQFAPHEATSGWAYGFWEDIHHGTRGLMHDGGGNGYRALVYVLPDQHLGVFLAYNLADRHPDGELLDVFRRRFLKTYFPAPARQAEIVHPLSVTTFPGYYRYVRRARTTMEKMISVVNIVRIDQGQSGTLTMSGATEEPVTLVPIAPTLFRRTDGRGLVAFDAVNENRAQRLVLDGGGLRTYDRISVLSTPLVQGMWLLGMGLVFVYAGFAKPVFATAVWVLRRDESLSPHDGPARPNDPHPARQASWLGGIASALNLLFIVMLPLVFLGDLSAGLPEFVYGVPKVALVLLVIPPVTAALAVATSTAVFSMWRDRRLRLVTRLEHTVVCAALLSFVAFTIYWRLMGIQT